jgi:hypothetical protein
LKLQLLYFKSLSRRKGFLVASQGDARSPAKLSLKLTGFTKVSGG